MSGPRKEGENGHSAVSIHDHEVVSISFSTGLVLTYSDGGYSFDKLVLVRQRKSGKWGIIAGGIKTTSGAQVGLAERPQEGVARELLEETGLPQNEITDPSYVGSIVVPGQGQVRLGWIYESRINLLGGDRKKVFNSEYNLVKGYAPKNGEEISLVRALPQNQVFELVNHPNRVYKPGFNIPILSWWLYETLSLKYAFEGSEFTNLVASARYGLGRKSTRIFVET